MSKLTQQIRHFRLHPHAKELPVTDVVHATVAAEMLEAAKGGVPAVLETPTGNEVTVHPQDDLGTVTARIAEAMPATPPPATGATPGNEEEAMPDEH